MKEAIVEMARKERAASREAARADMQEQLEYKSKKRAENLVKLLIEKGISNETGVRRVRVCMATVMFSQGVLKSLGML